MPCDHTSPLSLRRGLSRMPGCHTRQVQIKTYFITCQQDPVRLRFVQLGIARYAQSAYLVPLALAGSPCYAARYTGRSRCPLPAPRQPDGAMGKEEQVSTTKVSSEGLANQSIQSLSTQTQTIQRV